MCQTVGISLLAATAHGITGAIALSKAKDGKERRSYVLFLLFYIIMECFQASQWLWGDVGNCTLINTSFTFVAYFLIWIQPYLYVELGRGFIPNNQLQYQSTLSKLTLVYAMLMLVMGLSDEPSWILPNSNFDSVTCTRVGPEGHLGWYFSPKTIIYGPTFYLYMAMIIVTIWYWPWILQKTLGIGWIGSSLVALYQVGTAPDLPAYWCLLSIFADIPILIRCLT